MRRLAPILLFAAALSAARAESPVTRDGDYWVRSIQGTVSNGRLRLDTMGNVALQGTPTEQGKYTATLRVRAENAREAEALLDRISVKTATEGGWTYIKVTPPRWGSQAFEMRLSTPRALHQVRIVTAGGNVKASDLDGDLIADSGGGEIDVDHIVGAGRLRTGGGNLSIGAVGGSLQAMSAGGTIRVENAGMDATLETAGGEIFVHRAGGPLQASTGGGNIRVDDAASTVLARTAGGLIQVQHAGGPVTAESSGGAIQVDSADGVRCEAAGGAIRLRNVAGPVHAFANSGSIMAEFSGRSVADSVLSTNAGDITVFLPSNVPLTVQAMNESGGTGRIISDFPQVRTQSGRIPGGPVVAEGALNGGGPVLRVNVVGGTIYLRRAK